MKLKFKKQQYQDDAVMSIVNCFSGQVKGSRRELLTRYVQTYDEGTLIERTEEIEISSSGNHPITLTDRERRRNIRDVQLANNIKISDDNVGLTDFTIEMETGTGKTYTYIKTMYELSNYYGWNKFIIMVPSVAIREGVKKSFEITQEHFQEIYNKKIRFFVYNSSDSANIPNIKTFASDESIQVMIITYQAFSGKGVAKRKIYDAIDESNTIPSIDIIKSVRPILIIDEPQNIGNKTEILLQEFNPLFTIRYSATHKKEKEYNKIYRLDAIDAYNQRLVKKINVKGIEILHNKSEDTYLFLDKINISSKHVPEAMIEIEVSTSSGTSRRLMKIKVGDNLYDKSRELKSYEGYKVSEIDAINDKVVFANGVNIYVGQAFGDITKEHITRIQIRETIRSHFEKEKELYKSNIKVLSLFFIDEVAKYKYYDDGIALKGDYARIFEEEYMNALADYRNLLDEDYTSYLDSFNVKEVHAGYFSVDKRKKDNNGEYILIDNEKEIKKDVNGESISFDRDAFDLIMKDKERLLSLEEPVRFIFSHSALKEGWDNPNIFQICTLKHSNSIIKKRQEIGRGLRICVNNNGERMDYETLEDNFHAINTLTVVASESYDDFAKSLQTEMINSLSDRPTELTLEWLLNRKLVNSDDEILEFDNTNTFNFMFQMKNKGYLDESFKITVKFIDDKENGNLDYGLNFNNFIKEITEMITGIYNTDKFMPVTDGRKESVNSLIPNDNFLKKEFQYLWSKINVKTVYEVDFSTDELIEKAIRAIDLKLNVNLMKVRITEGTQGEEITTLSLKNQESMMESNSRIEVVDTFISSKVKYDLIGELTKETGLTRKTIIKILSGISPQKFEIYKYNPEEFIRKVSNLINREKAMTVVDGMTYHKTNQRYSDDIFTINNVHGILGENVIKVKRHIYNYLKYDSEIEKKFAEKLETSDDVLVYAKLPNTFKISTPVGEYNPDWAIVFKNPKFKYTYFVVETKGSTDSNDLRKVEDVKIACAKKHFKCLCTDKFNYDVVDSYDTLIDMLYKSNG